MLGIDFAHIATLIMFVAVLQQKSSKSQVELWNRYKGLTYSRFSANFHLNKRSLSATNRFDDGLRGRLQDTFRYDLAGDSGGQDHVLA